MRRLRSREEAEDAAQIVFLNAHRCLEEGVQPQSERAWLFKIAENVVMYRWRTISRRARVEFPIDVGSLADLVVAPGRDVPSELDSLPEALARIPETQRRAIVLREWYGLSYREVAVELGITASAAETLIFRARRRLAQELGGPEPIMRRRRPLSLASPLASLKWLLGGGTTVKAIVGATSVAVIAVGSAKVEPLLRPAPRAVAPLPQKVIAPSAVHALRPVLRSRAVAIAASHSRKARARARHAQPPVAAASAPAPVVRAPDPVDNTVVAVPAAASAPASDTTDTQEATPVQSTETPPSRDRTQAAVADPEPAAPVDELPVPDESPLEQTPPVDPAAGGPVDPSASDPGQSGDAHGPNEMAAFGQAQRSDHASPNAADPGSNGQGAGPKNGDAIPQPSNDGAPDLSALPGTAPDVPAPADATDPTAAPGNSGNAGQPPSWAQGGPATSDPNGNAYGQAKQGIHGPGSAVAE